MKKLSLFLLVFMIFSCSESNQHFGKIECAPADSIPNSNLRKVFEPCKEFIFSAKFWDADYHLISHEKIWVMATGQGWEYQPASQDEIVIQYTNNPHLQNSLSHISINPEVQHWTAQESTGIIETESRTWMHPFRSNQYLFTEVAPFPCVQLPLKEGKTWTSNLNIHDGWGVWSNSTILNTYEVIGFEKIKTGYGKIDAWHVSSSASAKFGTSTHNFWYNMELGFVKMIIKNYAGQILQIELLEVYKAM